MDKEYTLEATDAYEAFINSKLPDVVVRFEDTPTFADFDKYVYLNEHLHHYIEIKKRYNVLNKYATTKVPLRKHSTAEHYFVANKIKIYYICVFEDCVAVLNLWEEPDKVDTMVARHDRGNSTDIYAFYNTDRFKIISQLLPFV